MDSDDSARCRFLPENPYPVDFGKYGPDTALGAKIADRRPAPIDNMIVVHYRIATHTKFFVESVQRDDRRFVEVAVGPEQREAFDGRRYSP